MSLFSHDWISTVLASKGKDALGACLSKNTSLSVPMVNAIYILVMLIRKSSTLENKIRNLFPVRSGLSNVLQQHANHEWMIAELLKINEWFHKCLKTCSKACEMEWLCNDTSFHFKWKNMLVKWQRRKNGKNKL